ncbi:MAG: hypothetical protein ACPGOV_03480 [Magnetovibrionaceae bacterium]
MAGLYGAMRLAKADAKGLQYFRTDPIGFYQSFFAALLILPPFALLLSLEFQPIYGAEGVDALSYWVVMMSAYVMGWTAYPIIMFSISRVIQRTTRYIRFIVAYNWAAVLQNAAYLTVELLRASGIITTEAAAFLALIVLSLVVLFSWFIAKTALDIKSGQAAGLVVIDFLLSMIIHGTARAILLG